MSKTKPLWKKMLSVALLGAFAMAPLAGASVAQAAPDRDHDRSSDHNQHDGGHDRGQSHDRNRDHGQNRGQDMDRQFQPRNQDHSNDWNRGHDSQHDWNRGHDQFRSHDDHFQGDHFRDNHFRSDHFQNNHFSDNHWRDDNWHRRYGYTRSGSLWLWHGHEDAWWLSHGYWWNGSIWIIIGDSGPSYNYDDYGPFRDFTGVVAAVHGDQEFDIRINGDIYNVYTTGYVPYRLDDGDLVRVYGQRYGNNDIRNSNVKILEDD